MLRLLPLPHIEVIPRRWLPALRTYRGVGDDASLVRRFVTNPFYELLMRHVVPEGIAPNVITLIGFSVLAASALLASLFGDYSSDDVPRWVFLVCALCLFFYQTMDNLDGKQARRTGSSSPLGEILDHGCDALGCTIGGVAHVMAAVPGPNAIYIFLIALCAMSFATWEEYYAGGMFLGPLNGPNEGLFCIMFTELLAFAIGQRGMATPLAQLLPAGTAALLPEALSAMTPAVLINTSGMVAMLFTVSNNILNVYHYANKGPRHRRHGLPRALLGMLPFAVVLGTYALWARIGTVFQVHPHLFILSMGMAFAYYNTNITLAYILGSPLKVFDLLCAAHLLALLNITVPVALHRGAPLVPETTMFYALLATVAIFYYNFAVSVVSQVSGYLGIPVLRLPEHKASRRPSSSSSSSTAAAADDDTEGSGTRANGMNHCS